MADIFGATVLTGGGATALDSIDGADLTDGDAAVVITDSGTYHYHLDASSGASENSPYVIAPDTNAGTKRWLLMAPVGPMSHVRATDTAGGSLANDTLTKKVYATEGYDTLSEYDTANSRFTAKNAGYYIVTAKGALASSSGWATPEYYYLAVIKNGTAIAYNHTIAFDNSTGVMRHVCITTTVYLAESDYIEIHEKQNSGDSRTVDNTNGFNYLTIDRIA